MTLAAYRKTIAAVVGAVIVWAGAVVASASGPITAGEWIGGATALAVALGVYAVPND